MKGELIESVSNFDELDNRKKILLEKLIESLGNKTEACARAVVSRQTLWNWCDESEEYAKAVEMAVEKGRQYRGDLFERKLDEHILVNDSEKLLEFALKTQFKDRGYVSRSEHTGAEGKPIELIQFYMPGNSRDDEEEEEDTD